MAKYRVVFNDVHQPREETIKADDICYDNDAHAYTFWKGDKPVAVVPEHELQFIVRQS